MSHESKDSVEVVRFMKLFSRLKNWCDDMPEDLVRSAAQDESIRELCRDLRDAARSLLNIERSADTKIAAPVDPKFIASMRDFEKRYAREVFRASWGAAPIFIKAEYNPEIQNSPQKRWEQADSSARMNEFVIEDLIDSIDMALDLDQISLETDEESPGPEFGIRILKSYLAIPSCDIRGVLRRESLIPFFLLPRNVSAKVDESAAISMTRTLREAHTAFIHGAPLAALALMRSTMETVLRDHYKANGDNLHDLIKNVQPRLPRSVRAEALHRLRKFANSALHLDNNQPEVPALTDKTRLEEEVASLLIVLRDLIEGVV